MVRLILALITCCLFFAEQASAQGGYTKEKYKQHGLSFELARDYDWLAIQPNEEWVVLQWVDTSHEGRSALRNSTGGKLQVVRIEYVSDPGPDTPGSRGPADGEQPSEKPGPKAGEEEAEEEKPKLPINSWARYAERELAGWHVGKAVEGKERDGFEVTEYELIPKKSGKNARKGWACVFENSKNRTFVLFGQAYKRAFDDQLEIWQHTAKKMRFDDPVEDPEIVKWRRFYERRPKFKGADYRVRVRTSLDGDWEAEDTENYIVIYNTKDQPLIQRIVRDLEYIREEYVELFPPSGDIDAVSTVRICADRDEYMAYGGMQGSAGYWYYVTEELVFYDATKREKGKKTEKADNLIVLYHEAFHQYIYYSVGQLAPHSWFNEGYGDFFSGAQIKGGKVKRVGPNPWRLGLIQHAIERNEHTPWNAILRFEKKDYYGARRPFHYAQGWSMIYFLNTAKVVQRDPEWSKILPTYFEELKAAWRKEIANLEAADEMEDSEIVEAVQAAQIRARTAALELAFKDIDIEALEDEWAKYVLTLKL